MIHNEHERRVTTRKHAELTAALKARTEAKMPKGRNPKMHQLVTDGIRGQIDTLQAELDAYAALHTGDTHVELPTSTIWASNLPRPYRRWAFAATTCRSGGTRRGRNSALRAGPFLE
jgi:hypothetical protein